MRHQFLRTCIKGSTVTRTVQYNKNSEPRSMEGTDTNEVESLQREIAWLKTEIIILQIKYDIMKCKSISFVY